ncbi:MAG: hypothetical protein ACLPH3_12515 [Terracidiphilus sp.]
MRAEDRARKEIDRAAGDLTQVAAVDLAEDGTSVVLLRLPAIRRRLLLRGARYAQERPGGKRVLIDKLGQEIEPLALKPIEEGADR